MTFEERLAVRHDRDINDLFDRVSKIDFGSLSGVVFSVEGALE